MENGLNQNINNTQEIQKQLQQKETAKFNQAIRQIEARFLNFANSTKWIFYIPIGYIFRHTTKYGQNLQVPINCKRIQFPQFKIGSTSLGFLGYGMDFSTRQNLTDKGLTITYLANENWLQYMMLLKWFQLQDFTYYTRQSNNGLQDDKTYNKHGNPSNVQTVTINQFGKKYNYDLGLDTYGSTQGPMVPCNLHLLDNFNNRVLHILFQNCWLTNVSTIDLNYSKTAGTEIQGTFELKFSKYSIHFDSPVLKDLFDDSGVSKQTF